MKQVIPDYLQQFDRESNSLVFLPIIRIDDEICTISGAKQYLTEHGAITFAKKNIPAVKKALREQNNRGI